MSRRLHPGISWRYFYFHTMPKSNKAIIALAVIASALGFFVDAYDLLLFSIVRNQSLASFGLSGDALLTTGIDLFNAQLIGMLIGGIVWGIVGDVYGRRSVLFGSIILYSLATLSNGLVQGIGAYGICRFIAGLGLAGELGAGATLVSELMSKEHRGYGTMIVASVGVLGVVTASLIGDIFPWRTAYFIGGGLGIFLLALRFGVSESGLFARAKTEGVSRGNVIALITDAGRMKRYACLILMAMPIWYAIGILITFSPEIGKTLGLSPAPQAGKAVLFFYLGLTIGDLTTGYASQLLRNRKKIIAVFMGLSVVFCACLFLLGGASAGIFYTWCGLIGWASGYWAIFITVSAEQFGTNVRATVAVTAPNMVRGLTALLTIAFKWLKPGMGTVQSAVVIGAIVVAVAAFALGRLEETYGRDLDFYEKI
jgi:MFS transporter, putative metabolite:H+ symporter